MRDARGYRQPVGSTPVQDRVDSYADDVRDGKIQAHGGKSLSVLLYEATERIRQLERDRAFLWRKLLSERHDECLIGGRLPLQTIAELSRLRRFKRAARKALDDHG